VEKGLKATKDTIFEKRAMSLMLFCTASAERATSSMAFAENKLYPDAVSKRR
jgi:hypothetical protein